MKLRRNDSPLPVCPQRFIEWYVGPEVYPVVPIYNKKERKKKSHTERSKSINRNFTQVSLYTAQVIRGMNTYEWTNGICGFDWLYSYVWFNIWFEKMFHQHDERSPWVCRSKLGKKYHEISSRAFGWVDSSTDRLLHYLNIVPLVLHWNRNSFRRRSFFGQELYW